MIADVHAKNGVMVLCHGLHSSVGNNMLFFNCMCCVCCEMKCGVWGGPYCWGVCVHWFDVWCVSLEVGFVNCDIADMQSIICIY